MIKEIDPQCKPKFSCMIGYHIIDRYYFNQGKVDPRKIEKKEMTSLPPKHRNKDGREPIILLATLYKTTSPERLG